MCRTQLTNLVIDAVEESRHDWENGGLQSFHVIWQQSDVTLEESHPGSGSVHHRLHETKQSGLIWAPKGVKHSLETSPARLSRTCEPEAGMKC